MGISSGISVQSLIADNNEIAQRLFSCFFDSKERFEEARRLFSLFGDDISDSAMMALLETMMIKISNFFLVFSHCHMEVIVNMRLLESRLDEKQASATFKDSTLREVMVLTEKYRNYETSVGRVMQKFSDASDYFLFPSRIKE